MFQKFYKFYERCGELELQVAKYTLGLMTIVVFLNALLRTLGYPIAAAQELATFFFAWCVFMAADVAMRKDKLVCVDILVVKFPPKVQYYIKLVNYIIIAVFLVFLVVYGVQISYLTRFRAFHGIYFFSYTWVTIAVPIGAFLMFITAVLKIREQIIKGVAGFEIKYTTDSKEFL